MIQLIAKLNSEVKKELPGAQSQKWWGLTPGRVYKAEADDVWKDADGDSFVHLETDGGRRSISMKRFIRK